MIRRRETDKIVAAFLSLLMCFASVGAYAAENPTPLAGQSPHGLRSTGFAATTTALLAPSSFAPPVLRLTGSLGDVAFRDSIAGGRISNCRTGPGASASFSAGEARVLIPAGSSVNFGESEGALEITLLGGRVYLDGAPDREVRIRTYGGTYILQSGSRQAARFSWRNGQLTVEGIADMRADAPASDFGLQLTAAAAKNPGRIAAVVRDPLGKPLAGVPVVFASSGRGQVAFAGNSSIQVLTDNSGVAETGVAVLGGQPIINAVVVGTAAAVPIPAPTPVPATSGGQRVLGYILLGAVGALAVGLAFKSAGDDDPVMVAGTPTLGPPPR